MTNTDAVKVLREALESCRDFASSDNNGVAFDIADKALAATEVAAIQPDTAKPFAFFAQPSGFGPYIECEATQAGCFPAYRTVPAQPERAPVAAIQTQGEAVAWRVVTTAPEGKEPLVFLLNNEDDANWHHKTFAGSTLTPLCSLQPLQDAKAEQEEMPDATDHYGIDSFYSETPAATVQVEASELPKLPDLPKPLKTTERGTPLFFMGQMLDFARAYGQLCRDTAPAITEPAPAMQSETPTVGAIAWAVLAANGNIRYWSYERANVNKFAASIGDAPVVPIIGAAHQPAAPGVGARDGALEEAATECERMMMFPGGRQECQAHNDVWAAAKAIRALKSGAALSGRTEAGEA